MKPFIDKLIEKIKQKKSHIVVGLDPDYDKFPIHIRKKVQSLDDFENAIYEFNKNIIDAVYDLVPAIKPQIAFYERYGLPGLTAFKKTIDYGKQKDLIVIEDCKRNDIGSTASAYADGHIGKITLANIKIPVFDVDAITVNPYLGTDGILPFIESVENYGKGLFILVKTSNKSSYEIQDLIINTSKEQGIKLYEYVAKLVNNWGKDLIGKYGYSSIGAVVGATFPSEANVLRELMPNSYFLVPGFGAQGGTVSDIIPCFNKDGFGALISASRSIIYAYQSDKRFSSSEFPDASRSEVLSMNNKINRELKKMGILNW